MAITLVANRWYAWQMLPGYLGQRCLPYCCPIYVTALTPKKTGDGVLQIDFWNTGYALGVRDFSLEMKLLHRGRDYLIGRIEGSPGDKSDRCGIVSAIEFGWIEAFCPELWRLHPPSSLGAAVQKSVSLYLDAIFLPNKRPN